MIPKPMALYSCLTAFLFGVAGGFTITATYYKKQIIEIKYEHEQLLTNTLLNSISSSNLMKENYETALRKSEFKSVKNKMAADAARNSSDGLRGELENYRATASQTSAETCIARTNTVTTLFDHCQRTYSELAGTADRIANDRDTLRDAWPDNFESPK